MNSFSFILSFIELFVLIMFPFSFTERGLEIGVLQENADLLKSQNVSLNEEAQALSLQMTVCS